MKAFTKALLTLPILLSFHFAFSQRLQWAYNISMNSDIGVRITTDINGDIVATGNYSTWIGTTDFDPTADTLSLYSNSSSQDVYIAKYDQYRKLKWAIDLGGASTDAVNGLTTDKNGNIYVCGSFYQDILFTPVMDSSAYHLASGFWGHQNGFVAKYDKNGSFLWGFPIKGGERIICKGIAVDSLQNVYVTGTMRGLVDFDPSEDTVDLETSGAYDIFIAKYNANAEYQWAYNFGSGSIFAYEESGEDIIVDGNYIYVTGNFSGTDIDFDPNPLVERKLSSGGKEDPFLAKYDMLGTCYWAHSIRCSYGVDLALGIDKDIQGNIYITGTIETEADFDPSADTAKFYTMGADNDIYIAKYDRNGNYQRAILVGGSGDFEVATDIDVTNSGSVYITGTHMGPTDFDPSPSNSLTGSQWELNLFAARYDTSFTFKWAMDIGTENWVNAEYGNGIHARDNGMVYLTGFYIDDADFDPSPGTFNLLKRSSSLGFIASYDGNFIIPVTPISVNESSAALDLYIYPNPSSGILNIKSRGERISAVEVVNQLGEVVKRIEGTGDHHLLLNLASCPTGIYLVRAGEGENATVRKVVIL